MKRGLTAILILILASLACSTGSSTPRPDLFSSPTPEPTQTPYVVEITSTANPTYTPVVVVVTPETQRVCVNALVAVHLRPSPSNQNYPITQIPNGTELVDLGGRSGTWYFVEHGTLRGWVHSGYLGNCK